MTQQKYYKDWKKRSDQRRPRNAREKSLNSQKSW